MTKRRWLLAVLILGVFILAASAVFSRALRASAARRYLIAHLSASFGRPVDVSWFDFSLLDGARIEAHFVSVSDDPEFGNEYFLRADTLAAGLRWTSLLAGRFEFGSVSLSRPSLNLVRDADGRWNIERWLPPAADPGTRPGFVGPVAPPYEIRPERPYRIDVDGGRINFKQGDKKGTFALVDVSGRVEQNGAGRWQLDVEARPMRAGVELQDIGTVRLRGSIAGTTARLQPAQLNLTWRAASLADTLRLIRQNDYGMRGQVDVDLSARIAPPETSSARESDSARAQWSVSAVARLTGIHSWRLPEHDTDPPANLSVQLNWRPGERHAEFQKVFVELPASNLQASGNLDWSHGFQPQLRMEPSTLAFGDVLSWYRALQPDVAEDLRASGVLGVDLKIGGWPVQFQQGEVTSAGGTLTAKTLSGPLRIGAINASVAHGGFDFAPTSISVFSARVEARPVVEKSGKDSDGSELRNSFVIRGSLFPRATGVFRWPPDWSLSIEGETSHVQDWLAISSALARPVNSGWTAEGGFALKMRRVRLAVSPEAPWIGTIDFLGLTFSPTYVNQPVRLPKAHIEFSPLQRTITLSAAEAFGAIWRGALARKYSDKTWIFDLSADHLDAVELDRWLGPRARPGFLARFAGLNPTPVVASPIEDSVVTKFAARGHLRVGEIELPPMHLEHLDADAELAGRTILIRKAQADFFGGTIAGSLDAHLIPDPSYQFQGRFDRVDLAQLARAVPLLDSRIGGTASAVLALSTHGIGRQNLNRSLQGQGTINGKNIELRGFHLRSVFPGAASGNESDTFSSVQGTYRIQTAGIDLSNFVMDNSTGRLEAEGRIEFSHTLSLQVHPSIFQAAAAPASASPPSLILSGTIEIPKLVVPSASPKPAARSGSR
jgi:uncharacterized protein involved in outer membrane biogenesis